MLKTWIGRCRMFKVMVNLETLKSAKHMKDELEKLYPLLDGRIQILEPQPVRPLSEIIKEENAKFKKRMIN
jgi:hypothetical protein